MHNLYTYLLDTYTVWDQVWEKVIKDSNPTLVYCIWLAIHLLGDTTLPARYRLPGLNSQLTPNKNAV